MKLEDFEIIKPPPPHDKSTWIKIEVHIRKNETGEIHIYNDDGIWNEYENCFSDFIWEDGNFKCDCNRYLFFERANGKECIEEEIECSDGKYSVNIYNPKNKELIYREFDE